MEATKNPKKRYIVYCYNYTYRKNYRDNYLIWYDNLDDAVNYRPSLTYDRHEVIDTMTGEIIYHN